jgi:hypothetical protein
MSIVRVRRDTRPSKATFGNAVVMLAHSFVVRGRLETGENRSDFPSFEEVINRIVRESAIRGLLVGTGCY